MYRWYVVNTYSGHENKVKQNLEHRVVSLNQKRAVRQVVVPTETVTEMKDNQKIPVEKRTMPGYVLVNMELTDDSWQLVKGTPAEGRVVAKTGALFNVRSMAGYLTTLSGEPMAFAILVNNFQVSNRDIDAISDKALVRLVEFAR